jgi:hypothetical protein
MKKKCFISLNGEDKSLKIKIDLSDIREMFYKIEWKEVCKF